MVGDSREDSLRLHIGGHRAAAGWLVMDIRPGPAVDIVGDCRDLSRFSDASVADIYLSHVLEHLGYREELQAALAEFHRVLVPSGRLMISVPDLDVLCRLFGEAGRALEERFHLMRIMFGGQTDAYDFHKVGLNHDILADYLAHAGFRAMRRVEEFGLFEDSSTIAVDGTPISLNVVAFK